MNNKKHSFHPGNFKDVWSPVLESETKTRFMYFYILSTLVSQMLIGIILISLKQNFQNTDI